VGIWWTREGNASSLNGDLEAMSILICRCGSWLKAPSPEDKAQGRCPTCGRVISPDGTVSEEPDFEAVKGRGRKARKKRKKRSSHPRRGRPLTLHEALAYPLSDGPGLALMAVFPPFLTIMSVPVFDILVFVRGESGEGFNPLAILLVPFALPLMISFTLTFGYVLLYLGRVLTNSAMGRTDHPRYPLWDWQTIVEGVGRWVWAGIVGLGVGGLPALIYIRVVERPYDPFDWIVVGAMLAAGAGYVQIGLAASILHDNIALAHPFSIARAIGRIGSDFLRPWLAAALAIGLTMTILYSVLYLIPSIPMAVAGLWGFWVFWIYESMVVMHLLGWCCYRNGAALGWFRHTPSWGGWERPGRIYSNS